MKFLKSEVSSWKLLSEGNEVLEKCSELLEKLEIKFLKSEVSSWKILSDGNEVLEKWSKPLENVVRA